MATISVDSRDLLRFARNLEELPRRSKKLIADALNDVGDGMVRNVVNTISDETGLPATTLASLVRVRRATPSRHEFEVDISDIYSEDRRGYGPGFNPRGFSGWMQTRSRNEFNAEELVNVVTAEDDTVCPECERIAEEGPYSLSEAQTLIPHHPHCRCQLVPFISRKRLAFSFEQSTGAQRGVRGGISHVQRATLKSLSDRIMKDMVTSLKVKR